MSERSLSPQLANSSQEQAHIPPRWQQVVRTIGTYAARAAANAAPYAALATAGAALSIGVGTTLIPVESKLGPHNVETTIDLKNQAALDLGALGSIIKHRLHANDMPIGAHVTVKEIPYDGTSLGLDDVMSYASFFDAAGRDAAMADMRSAFIDRIQVAGGLGLVAGLALAAYRDNRRRSYAPQPQTRPAVARRRKGLATAVTAATVLVAGGGQAVAAPAVPNGDPTLEALGIHDVEVRGALLKTALEKYSYVAQTIKATDTYYADIGNNVVRSYDELIAIEQADPQSPYNQYAHLPHKIVAVISDMHCNTAQAAQIGRFADHAGAQHILDAGDRTISGYPFEKRCIEALANNTKAKVITALGNHDSPDVTAAQSKEAGDHVLDDEVIVVDGIAYFGGKDRNRSLIGQGTKQWGPESTHQHGVRLAQKACEEESAPDIAIVHDPVAAQRIAETGCVPLVIAGHEHQHRHQTFTTGRGIAELDVMGSTGGAAGGEMTIASKLGQEAHMKLLVLDEHNNLVFARNIFMNPNKDVRITTETYSPVLPIFPPLAAKPN